MKPFAAFALSYLVDALVRSNLPLACDLSVIAVALKSSLDALVRASFGIVVVVVVVVVVVGRR